MAESGEEHSLEDQFKSFAKFGDAKSAGDAITLSNLDKWFKQSKVIDGKKITTTDTGIYFKQIAKTKKSIGFKEFTEFTEKLAKSKKIEVEVIHKKLRSTGPPGTTGTTNSLCGRTLTLSVVKMSTVDRLTDTSKYTGSSKQRFDESGKGKGKQGRADVPDSSGYVSGYKDAGTFDEKTASP